MEKFKFEFELDAEDVTNLFGCIQDSVNDLHSNIMDEMSNQNRPEYIQAYRARIGYLTDLQQKLHHTKIPDEVPVEPESIPERLENLPLEDGYTVVCVWPGTLVGELNKDDFVKWMLDTLGTRIQYLEDIKTGPDYNHGFPVEGTGGRIDAFFAVHNEDVSKFAVPRLSYGIRWLEDVYFNKQGYLYPERVKEYVTNPPKQTDDLDDIGDYQEDEDE